MPWTWKPCYRGYESGSIAVHRLWCINDRGNRVGCQQFQHPICLPLLPFFQVSFDSKQGRQLGTLIKFNQKTVTVITDDGRRWRISPHLLSKVKDAKPEQKFIYNNKNKTE